MKNRKLKLDGFGYREMALAGEILTQIGNNGLPEGFDPSGLAIELNPSGDVYLINSSYQMAALNGDSLERYYILPNSGEEGVLDELKELDLNELPYEDVEYLKSIGI